MSKTQATDLLKRTKVRDVLGAPETRRTIVTQSIDATMGETARALGRESILSMPVVSKCTVEGHQEGVYLGVVDCACMLDCVMRKIEELGGLPMSNQREFLFNLGNEMEMCPVRDFFGYDASVAFKGMLDESVYNAIHLIFCKNGQESTHRIVLLEGDGRIGGIMSQSDIVRFLYSNQATLGNFLDISIADLGLIRGPDQLVVVPSSCSALQAFSKMRQSRVSAVAVVEPEFDWGATSPEDVGRIIANLSASDLRGLTPELLPTLLLPVVDFLKMKLGRMGAGIADSPDMKLGQSSPPVASLLSIPPPVTCLSSTTLRQVIGLLVERRVHRVYVVSETLPTGIRGRGGGPVGVITLSDVLKCIGGV